MQFVMVLEIDEESLDGDESIENAARIANTLVHSRAAAFGIRTINLRPLSEVIAS